MQDLTEHIRQRGRLPPHLTRRDELFFIKVMVFITRISRDKVQGTRVLTDSECTFRPLLKSQQNMFCTSLSVGLSQIRILKYRWRLVLLHEPTQGMDFARYIITSCFGRVVCRHKLYNVYIYKYM